MHHTYKVSNILLKFCGVLNSYWDFRKINRSIAYHLWVRTFKSHTSIVHKDLLFPPQTGRLRCDNPYCLYQLSIKQPPSPSPTPDSSLSHVRDHASWAMHAPSKKLTAVFSSFFFRNLLFNFLYFIIWHICSSLPPHPLPYTSTPHCHNHTLSEISSTLYQHQQGLTLLFAESVMLRTVLLLGNQTSQGNN